MSNHDDFWTTLATGHSNTVLAGAMDSHLSGKSIEESFGSVRTLTDAHRAANALVLPVAVGTKVAFAGNIGAYMSYDDVPADGILGEVVTVRSATGEITHHEGKVFVKWADGKFRPIHAEHLRLVSQGKTAAPRGKSQKALMEYIKDFPAGHRVELSDVVRHPSFRGVHFAKVMSAAEALAKQGFLGWDGSAITKTASTGKTAAVPRKKMEDAIAGKMPPDSKKGRGANRVIMLTGDSAKAIGKDNYSRHKMSDLSEDEITTLYNRLVLGKKASDIKAQFEKIKALAEKRPDSKFLKSILTQMADKGFAPTEKQMTVVKKIEDEIKQQGEMKKELKGLDKKGEFNADDIGKKQNGPLTSDPEDKKIMDHFGQGDLHEMTEVAKDKTATFRVASLGDLTDFLKVASGALVHKSTKDLWSYSKDADGNFLVSRLFDGDGEPLKV